MRKLFLQLPRLLVVIVVLALANPSLGEGPKKDAKNEAGGTLSQLSLDIMALQTLHDLDVNEAQLKTLREWTKQTLSKAQLRQDGKGSDKFRRALTNLRDALVANMDHRDLARKLEDIRDEEKPQLDDEVVITPEARRQAGDAGRLLTAGQVANYLAAVIEEMEGPLDPRERLIEAVVSVRDLSPEKWQEFQGEFSSMVGRLSAGVDAEKAERIGKDAIQLLTTVRGLSDADFKTQKPELEKKAQKIVGEISPFDVIRNVVEYTFAEMLSNPRLPQVIDARLKHEAAKKSEPKR